MKAVYKMRIYIIELFVKGIGKLFTPGTTSFPFPAALLLFTFYITQG